jgi:hypothetical protein
MDAPGQQHALFRQYPQTGECTISVGSVPIPYHVYDGWALLIGGTARREAVQALLAGEVVAPVLTTEDRALVGLWVGDFTQANLGPHTELQLSIFVTTGEQPRAPVAAHPLAALGLLAADPRAAMLCHGLWNNAPPVVAYNRELLGLPARLADSRLSLTSEALDFAFTDATSGAALAEGRIAAPGRRSLGAGLALARLLGAGGILRFVRQPWIAARVINPVGAVIPGNAAAQTFSAPGRTVLRFFDTAADRLAIQTKAYAGLDFTPTFVEFMQPFRFVYLEPG